MQFSIVAIVAAFAAVSSAQYNYANDTTSAVVVPSGTGAPSGTSAPSATIPFEGAAPTGAGSAMAVLIAAGGAALML